MDAWIPYLIEWGYVGMFVSAFLAGSFLPFASEMVMVACLGLGLHPLASVLVTTLGNTLGGMTCYWIGSLGKKEWIHKYLRISDTEFAKAERWVEGRGAMVAFFSFVPVIGDALLVVLGWMRSNFFWVSLSMFIGKLLRYALLAAATVGIIKGGG